MPRIFISHIHEDKLAAVSLMQFLRVKLNVPPEDLFLSSNKQIQIGSEWLASINSTFQRCSVIIALFSPESLGRRWVHFEAGGAFFSENKALMPVCIGTLDPCDLGRPYSNIMSANLHERATAEFLVSSVWKVLKPETGPLPPVEYPHDDPDVKMLLDGLDQWKALAARREKVTA